MLDASWLSLHICMYAHCVCISMMIAASVAAWMKSKFFFRVLCVFYAMSESEIIISKTESKNCISFHVCGYVFFSLSFSDFLCSFFLARCHLHSRIFIVWWFSGFSLPFTRRGIMCVRCYYCGARRVIKDLYVHLAYHFAVCFHIKNISQYMFIISSIVHLNYFVSRTEILEMICSFQPLKSLMEFFLQLLLIIIELMCRTKEQSRA
jgi:hypothetical protein